MDEEQIEFIKEITSVLKQKNNEIRLWKSRYDEMKEHAYNQDAKISERKTVHQWLNDKGVTSEENGKPICLLRRLAIVLNVHA